MKRVILSADDFGLSDSVNAAVEQAHREGVLGSASLMVGAPAAADAVRRARALPGLRVGLHLVVIEGQAMLPGLAGLTREGRFPGDQFRLGMAYCRHPRLLAAEIRAQFQAFAATGLVLDHADAHKHMHLHPLVGALMIRIGREFGLRAVRVPSEPPKIMRSCGAPIPVGARMLYRWSALLRRQACRAGLVVNDALFGLGWTGGMTEERLLTLIPRLPDGVSEIYFHPAARKDCTLQALMPHYDHVGELSALLSPRVRAALAQAGIAISAYGDLG